MNTQDTTKENVAPVAPAADAAATPVAATATNAAPATDARKPFDRGGDKREFRKNKRRSSKRPERVKSEFDQKTISVRRVTRVSSGGRRFTFSVAIIIGNRKGKVGVGIAKAGDTSVAIDKAVRNAKKNMIDVKRTKTNSIRHDVTTKFSSARISIMPAPGRGVIAGSAVKDVIELAGLNDVNAKIFSGSKNKLNIARAAVQALASLKK